MARLNKQVSRDYNNARGTFRQHDPNRKHNVATLPRTNMYKQITRNGRPCNDAEAHIFVAQEFDKCTPQEQAYILAQPHGQQTIALSKEAQREYNNGMDISTLNTHIQQHYTTII